MPIIKSYLLPHSPLLIPEIGRANHSILAKTTASYTKVKEDIIKNEIDSIVIISPHYQLPTNFFLINSAPEMNINFQDFGFIPPKMLNKGDIALADKIKTALKSENISKFITDPNLDYGSAIPLYLLKSQDREIKTVVISPADDMDLDKHIEFGKILSQALENSPKKIALIASGDLSHRLMRKSPGGYSSKGPKFDNKVIEYLSYPDTAIDNIKKIDKGMILSASECGLRPICILLGAISEKSWQPDILSYQTDFGVGYLSMEFKI